MGETNVAEKEIQQEDGNMLEYNIKDWDINDALVGRKIKLFMKTDD